MERRLPDTPWHVGYTKKADDDPRRHKSRCIHYMNGKCNSSCSHYYKESCGGSSHCEEYSETYEDYLRKLQDRKTAGEIEHEIIEKYKAGLARKKKELVKSSNSNCHKPTEKIRKCLVCDEYLENETLSLKKCTYCGMYYVNINDFTEDRVLEIVKSDEVFLMNIPIESHYTYHKTIVVKSRN